MKKILALILSVITLLGSVMLIGCSKEFTVTFEGNGGTQASDDKTSLVQTVSDAEDLVEPKFVREGYDFTGWDVAISNIDEDTVVKAQWAESSYTISFDKNGGTWDTGFTDDYTIKAVYGKKPEGTMPTATKAGYKFEKWVIVDDDTSINGKDFTGTEIYNYTKNIKVQAKWTDGYVINYDYDGGHFESGVGKTSFYATDADFTLETPVKTGYTFLGWTGEGFTKKEEVIVKPSEMKKDLSFKATWQAKTYTVTLNKNGGVCDTASVPAEYDKAITLPEATRTKCEFGGWSYNGLIIASGDIWKIDANVELVAIWIKYLDVKFATQYTDTENGNRVINVTSKADDVILSGTSFTTAMLSKVELTDAYVSANAEYEFSHWAYKDAGGNYVKIVAGQTLALEEVAKNDVITLYPVCKLVHWIGPY